MTDLQRAIHEQEQAEALLRSNKQPTHAVNENGYVQPMHDWIQWWCDNALEAELIRKEEALIRAEYATARAAGGGL